MKQQKPWFLFRIEHQVAAHVVIVHQLSGTQYTKANSDIQVPAPH